MSIVTIKKEYFDACPECGYVFQNLVPVHHHAGGNVQCADCYVRSPSGLLSACSRWNTDYYAMRIACSEQLSGVVVDT